MFAIVAKFKLERNYSIINVLKLTRYQNNSIKKLK